MDDSIYTKVERYLVRTKPSYSYIWDYWSRIYYYTYPEYHFLNELLKHYSFHIKCHDGTFVVNYIDVNRFSAMSFYTLYILS